MNKKDMLIKIHAYVASDGIIDTWKCKEIRGNNKRVRKRFRVRFYNSEETLIEDFIRLVNKVYPELKYIRYSKKRSEVEIRSQKLAKGILNLGEISTRNWQVPENINNKQKRIWISAFTDCDGTIQDYLYNRYVAIDSINLKGLMQIMEALNKLMIDCRIQKVSYKGYISYRLKISRRENLIKFNKIVGFTHPIKQRRLAKALDSYK